MISEIDLLVNELDKLSLSLDFVSERDGREILDAVNERVKEILKARIIDVRWREETQGGGISFKPVASTEPMAKRYDLRADSKGIWSWLFKNEKPVWLKKQTPNWPDQEMENEATPPDKIGPEFLAIDDHTYTIIAVPLFYSRAIMGAYTVQWPQYGKSDEQILKKLEGLAAPIARIARKVDLHIKDQAETTMAISQFRMAIQRISAMAYLNPYRTGLVARSFQPEFVEEAETVDNYIKKFLNEHGIEATIYENEPGQRGPIIEDIIVQIKRSHFGIVNISGNNPNVMLELGMFMVLGRNVLILCREEDEKDVPYDLLTYPIIVYRVEKRTGLAESDIKVKTPGKSAYADFKEKLQEFMETLQEDPAFAEAIPCTFPSDTE